MLNVPCHHTCTHVITFIPVFLWRVTFGISFLPYASTVATQIFDRLQRRKGRNTRQNARVCLSSHRVPQPLKNWTCSTLRLVNRRGGLRTTSYLRIGLRKLVAVSLIFCLNDYILFSCRDLSYKLQPVGICHKS